LFVSLIFVSGFFWIFPCFRLLLLDVGFPAIFFFLFGGFFFSALLFVCVGGNNLFEEGFGIGGEKLLC